jgi:hypothetical protein
VKQVLGEGVIRHELGDEQALIAIAAVADQVRQPRVPQLADPLRLLLQQNKLPVNPQASGESDSPKRRNRENSPSPTANCLGSGQASLANFFTAMVAPPGPFSWPL